MGLLTIIYWVLLVLLLLGAFAGSRVAWYPYANSAIILVLFIIIGLKILKPQW